MSLHEKTLIVVVGPTAVGKTSTAVALAKKLGTEVLSADSRQFYKEMQIGTARPSEEELEGVPHHFLGFLSIEDEYNAGMFERDAQQLIEKLFKKYDLLIMTGGSGLYIDAVCKGFNPLPKKNETLRKKLEAQFQKEGIEALQQELRLLDPEYFEKIDKQNPQRLIRAIEICKLSGEKYSNLRKGSDKQHSFNIIKVGLDMDRERLYQRINQRVDHMVQSGLLAEVRSLYPKKQLNALQTVGYRELFTAWDKNSSDEDAIAEIKKNTRRYAKRQLTWFRRDEDTTWFDAAEIKAIIEYVSQKTDLHL